MRLWRGVHSKTLCYLVKEEKSLSSKVQMFFNLQLFTDCTNSDIIKYDLIQGIPTATYPTKLRYKNLGICNISGPTPAVLHNKTTNYSMACLGGVFPSAVVVLVVVQKSPADICCHCIVHLVLMFESFCT